MKKTIVIASALSLLFGSLAAGITIGHFAHNHAVDEAYLNENGSLLEPIDIATHNEDKGPSEGYNEGVVLVKTFEGIDYQALPVDIASIEEIYPGSAWKKIVLASGTSLQAVKELRSTELFDKVDYDYVMGAEADLQSLGVATNPYAGDLPYIDSMGIGHAWAYGKQHKLGGENGGGSPDVVVAVIDTGVDYNHLDLAHNIWVNAAEIPANGIDDDGNGYVDDIRGWDCVNDDNNPMDDNGHGTHVAGIIAAENNNIGTVGVAFNCKIMPVKAGNSSGYFNNADIAEAIRYAYMNGASVINMSFGGSSISMAVEDALEDAYYQCVLVAAAGNNGACNQPSCPYCTPNILPSYPGCLPYTVGVMSCNDEGTFISSFSNYDHTPYHYNNYEYDVYACGEQIVSTWPNNKFARLSGTSMASPVVAGIAALLRSAYPDRDAYSSKFIHSQLSNAGTKTLYGRVGKDYVIDQYHPFSDALEALTNVPKPHIHNLYNWYAFDNVELSPNNNGDGFIDAGEKIRLGIELKNRGGKASDITAKIDTIRNGDPDITDPNIEILTDTITMDDIGTYSIGDGGKIYDGTKIVGMENAFDIQISDDAPNGYLCVINLKIEYYNGLENDHTKYVGECSFAIDISSGTRLKGVITDDTVFTNDKRYIVDDVVVIPEGVEVTFEEGCEIQFYDSNDGMITTAMNTPGFDVSGTLKFEGTADKMISMYPSENWYDYSYRFVAKTDQARITFSYCDLRNCDIENYQPEINFAFDHCRISCDVEDGTVLYLKNGKSEWDGSLSLGNINSSIIDFRKACYPHAYFNNVNNSLILCGATSGIWSPAGTVMRIRGYSTNNVIVNTETLNKRTSISIETEKIYSQDNYLFNNNAILTNFIPTSLSQMTNYNVSALTDVDNKTNYFDSLYREYSDRLFSNNYLASGDAKLNFNDSSDFDADNCFPFVKDVTIKNKSDEIVHTVGVGTHKVTIEFSRAMETSSNIDLYYGSWYPYSDYKVNGDFISDTVWEGTFEVKSTIEGGKQRFSMSGGHAKDDPWLIAVDNIGSFEFDIDVSQAFAMNLQANNVDEGVELTWVQDDYDTLMGYNIYRSQAKDGNFARINSAIIPSEENTFIDDSCEPGKTYWYTFTVVLSDFTESAPAGKVSIMTTDTITPSIYHTPVNQGYAGNNLVISCSASDNVAITSATLHYRAVGDSDWKSVQMAKSNDRYSAVIFGSEVTLAGIEYYISVSDGVNSISRGSADSPFKVTVKDASTLDNLGDVDGDGLITTKDALMIIRAINDELILTDDQFKRADLNRNAVLETFEALRILQYINGNVDSLEM